jgi:hypothetical protein
MKTVLTKTKRKRNWPGTPAQKQAIGNRFFKGFIRLAINRCRDFAEGGSMYCGPYKPDPKWLTPTVQKGLREAAKQLATVWAELKERSANGRG